MKWDGVRAVCRVAGDRVELLSRRGLDAARTYPEIAEALTGLGVTSAVLDGEVVAMDEHGRPSFSRLQQRIGLTRAAEVTAARRATPVQLVLFDLLALDGHSLLRQPYDTRRSMLLELIGDRRGLIQVPPSFDGPPEEVLEISKSLGLEGIVAKRHTSVYQAGGRGRTWLKIKNFRTQEVVVGGWKPGQGRRDGGVGSLLLGIPNSDGLAYVGKVGTGWTDAMLTEIQSRLDRLARKTSPFTRRAEDRRQGRPLGDALAGGRGPLRRVHHRPPAAAPVLAGLARGQVRRRRPPRDLNPDHLTRGTPSLVRGS